MDISGIIGIVLLVGIIGFAVVYAIRRAKADSIAEDVRKRLPGRIIGGDQ